MFDLVLPDKKPIIIISSHRTGSTALLTELGEKFVNCSMYNEPHNGNSFLEFENHVKLNNDYIVKFHAYTYKFYSCLTSIIDSNQCCLIRIRRKNIVSQITSLYISRCRNFKFFYVEQDEANDKFYTSLPLNITLIKQTIYDICSRNDLLEKFPANFDLNLYYEDLKFSNLTVKTPRPKNYNELLEIIENIYLKSFFK